MGEGIRKINSLNRKKATTSYSLPITNLKEIEDISGSILYKIINQQISNFHFPDEFKLAELSPLHKENDIMNKRNCRPISILPLISKVFERPVQEQITNFIKDYLYMYLYGYRKGYSTQHALTTLIEKWKKSLDGHGYFGAIITIIQGA